MDILNKLTINSLKLNKKRTIVTIVGIMLSVALITAVATMYASLIKSLIKYEVYQKGDFHVAYFDVDKKDIQTIKNNRLVKDIYAVSNIGYAKLEESKNESKTYIYVKGFTEESLKSLSVKLVEGSLPKNEKEILIPTHLKTNGRVTLNIGDEITINIGKRVSDGSILNQNNPYNENEEIIDTVPISYKIVGIIERPATNIESYEAPGYTFITYMDENDMRDKVDLYIKYNKKNYKDYLDATANILNMDEEIFKKAYTSNSISEEDLKAIEKEFSKAKYDYNVNSYLIELETDPLGSTTTGDLKVVVMIVCIIIIVSSIFCIKNSFDISITEKIKHYGMLRSMGATKKQIKRNVFHEATILGIFGIPLGLLLGFLASYILIIISNLLLEDMHTSGFKLVLSYSWISFIVAIILGLVTIYLSALKSAKKASRTSPIESIKNSANIKIKSKKVRCPKYIRKIFGIGGEISYKNLKRNKKKYRTTIVSITISVAVFIALSYFINSAFTSIKLEIKEVDYNIHLDLRPNTLDEEKVSGIAKLENIKDYAVYKGKYVFVDNPKYNKDYKKVVDYTDDLDFDSIHIRCIGDYQYKKYLKKLKLDYEEFKDKGILIDTELLNYKNKNGKNKKSLIRKFTYQKGDIINLYQLKSDEDRINIDIELGAVTNILPFGYGSNSNYSSSIIVSDEMFNKLINENQEVDIYIDSSNPDKFQDDVDEYLQGEKYNLYNQAENVRMMKNLFILISIFLYGFIIVITNIFNTITTNMELRKQEFAMLKSIGMTKKEFNKMIRLESVFMGFKSLLFGIVIGSLLSYLLYNFLVKEANIPFKLPILAIIICIICVYLLITMLMWYSMHKINRQNTIETIRNENI